MNPLFARSVLSFAIALPLAAQEHDLKLNVTAGSSVWYMQSTTVSQEIDMGQIMETKNVMSLTIHMTVKEVGENGNVIVEARIARVRGSFDLPMMGESKFDSIDLEGDAKPAAGGDDFGGMGMPDFDAIGRAAAGFAGTTLIARLDAHGKCKSLDGVEQALEAMQKRAGQMGSQMLAQSFSKSSFEALIESAFGIRPDKPTTVGGSWSNTESNEDGPGTATNVKFTLASVSDKAFEVTGTGTIEKPEAKDSEPPEDETEAQAMGREMQKNMKIENGKITGRSVVSREDGFIVEASSETSMDMTMQGPFGGDMTMKMKTQVVTRRTTEQAAMQGKKGDNVDGKDGGK